MLYETEESETKAEVVPQLPIVPTLGLNFAF